MSLVEDKVVIIVKVLIRVVLFVGLIGLVVCWIVVLIFLVVEIVVDYLEVKVWVVGCWDVLVDKVIVVL